MNDDRFRQLMKEFQEDVARSQAVARAEAAERAAKEARAELRDRFAERAMEKMIDAAGASPSTYRDEHNRKALAKLSYSIADAMLKARGQ